MPVQQHEEFRLWLKQRFVVAIIILYYVLYIAWILLLRCPAFTTRFFLCNMVINDLLEAPPARTDSEPPLWANGYNVWSLLKNPEQDTFETPTSPLTQDFDSGFLGATLDTLGEFASSFGEPERGGIANEIFGILDERSQQDSTVIIVKWELYVTEEYLQPVFTGEGDGLREGWQFVRHKFCGAATFISSLNFNDINAYLSDPAALDEHGVYK